MAEKNMGNWGEIALLLGGLHNPTYITAWVACHHDMISLVSWMAGRWNQQMWLDHEYPLGLPPTQDASHHQDYYIFSRESL